MSSEVSTVNGCNQDDLRAFDQELRAGRPITSARVGAGCDLSAFSGTDPGGGNRTNDVPLALNLTRTPGAITNRVALDLALTISF